MVVIPIGSFRMGDIDGTGNECERPVHWVSIEKAFAIGRYPVTFHEYDYYAKAAGVSLPRDVGRGRGRRPVINVSWNDAKAYAHWLAEQTGQAYRLPSEAEWEYAARAGTKTPWYWPEGEEKMGDYAWTYDNAGHKTHPVGKRLSNDFGLYDMAGTVWEWVEDAWHDDYQAAPTNGSAWVSGDGVDRVLRGGSRDMLGWDVRSANRRRLGPDFRYDDIGFRLALGQTGQ